MNININIRSPKTIIRRLEKIMATQEQLVQDLTAVKEQIVKVGVETGKTLQKVTDLEAALATAGNTTPEVDAAVQALKDQVKLVDDMVPDVVVPT